MRRAHRRGRPLTIHSGRKELHPSLKPPNSAVFFFAYVALQPHFDIPVHLSSVPTRRYIITPVSEVELHLGFDIPALQKLGVPRALVRFKARRGRTDAAKQGQRQSILKKSNIVVRAPNGGDNVVVGDDATRVDHHSAAHAAHDRSVSPASAVPQLVSNLSDVAEVRAGGAFTCARRTNGDVLGWGENTYEELAQPHATLFSRVPARIDVQAASDMAVGQGHACVLVADGNVWCWASNYSGQIAASDQATFDLPTLVSPWWQAII